MKKLLSLPPNLVGCFHEITKCDPAEWFCTSDPEGARLGSGGGTTWLLESCRRTEMQGMRKIRGTQGTQEIQKADESLKDFAEWIGKEKRILLHAGGQGRRVPSYAPSGKILTPIPVFRWERGQKLSQDLLSLQLPLYEKIMEKAPETRAYRRLTWCATDSGPTLPWPQDTGCSLPGEMPRTSSTSCSRNLRSKPWGN